MRQIFIKLKLLPAYSQPLVVFILLLGATARLIHLGFINTDFPFRYGGLFAEFSEQIAAHGYSLPRYIPHYTEGGIPFAYPPLPFYVEAVLIDLLSSPKFLVVTLLPPSVSVLALISFYILTRDLELDLQTQVAALVAFALMPAAFMSQIEGGGLAEAFGGLALIWLVISLLRAQKHDRFGRYFVAGLFWAACVVSSPGSAYASVPTVLIFALVQFARDNWRPKIRTVANLGIAGIVAVAASSPYWLAVITNHGTQVFVESFIAQHGNLLGTVKDALGDLARFQVSRAPYPLIWDLAILSGAIWALLNRRWALVAWFVALMSIPREGWWMAAIPAALMVGAGSAKVIGPLLLGLLKASRLRKPEQVVLASGFVAIITAYVLLNPALVIRDMVTEKGLSSDAIAAMEWVRKNTPAESRFVVISRSQVMEWFPQLARRVGLNGVWGSEWEPEEHTRILTLQEILDACVDLHCIQTSVAEMTGHDALYLYVDSDRLSELVSSSSGHDAVFESVYRNTEVTIGRLSPP